MRNYNGFIINPDVVNTPGYRIGPFTTNDLCNNHSLFVSEKIDPIETDKYFKVKFGEDFKYTTNGREGIYLALKSYDLKETDLVTILTTSQNYYISSCVTKEIEKFCRWNREIVPETNVILVNHEFGTVYPQMEQLVATGLPIIEDCCTTFFSQDVNGMVGKYGDFALYSFPKFFPIQIGGLLVNNKNKEVGHSGIDEKTKIYIQKVLNRHLGEKEKLLEKRQTIFDYALGRYQELGFISFFFYNKLQVPSLMMLKNNGIISDLPALKIHLWNHGIQSSVFYGEDAFFIPSHQNLSKLDIEYFFEVINKFIIEQ